MWFQSLSSFLLFVGVILLLLGAGRLIIGALGKQFSYSERLIISIITGFIVWSIALYGAAWVQSRIVSFVLITGIAAAGWATYYRDLITFPWRRINWLILLLLVAGVAAQLYLVAPSGFIYADGMRFYGVNAHDGMWHVALLETLQHSFPPQVPTYAGIPLKGYHYLIDLWGSELVRVFHIPAVDLVFRWFPALFSLLSGLGIYALLRRLTKSRGVHYLGVLLTYFAGSLGFVLSMIGKSGHAWETAFWAQQSISTYINLPLGASFAILTAILILLTIFFNSDSNMRSLWLTALMVGVMLPIKAYGGILVLGAFVSILTLYGFITKKTAVIGPIGLSLFLTALFVIPQFQVGTGLFLWQPGWFLKTMMETPDRVNYPLWELKRQTYTAAGNLPRVAEYWLIAFVVFFVGNMGVRMAGFIPIANDMITRKKTVPYATIFMLMMVVAGTLIPMFVLQKGIVWNAIQFMYYPLFIMNIFAALCLDRIKQNRIKILVLAFIVLITVPTTIKTLTAYYENYRRTDGYFLVTHDELNALQFIKRLPFPTALMVPYSDESYLPAITGKGVYYADETQALILSLPLDRHPIIVRMYCHNPSNGEIKELMETYRLKYLYTTQSKNVDCHPNFDTNPFLTKVFTNSISSVYKLN